MARAQLCTLVNSGKPASLEQIDADRGGPRVAPEQHRLLRVAAERDQVVAVLQQEARMAAGDHQDHAVDIGRLGREPRELRIAALVNGLRGDIDRILRGAVGRQIHVDPGARRIIEQRHVEAGERAGIRHPGAAAAGGRRDRDAVAGRQALAHGDERRRDIDHLVEIVALDHAVCAEQRAVFGIVAARRRVRARSRARRLPRRRAG